MKTWDKDERIRKAKIKGNVVNYDVCSSKGRHGYYDEKIFNYIGQGTIHSINCVMQNGTDRYYFWTRKK